MAQRDPEPQPADSLTIRDNRTGRSYELPIHEGAIHATDLRQVKVSKDDAGVLSYDPAFLNTASCRSAITYIDGDRGILRYRGYPIEELAEKATFLEVAFLLLFGELPTRRLLENWTDEITHHTLVHENIRKLIDTFQYDAHPMGILVGTTGALSTFYPEAKVINDRESRHKQIVRLIAKIPTLAAFAYRHQVGLPYAYPDNDLSYTGNFLNMMWKTTELKYQPNPVIEHALDVLFILHADHEQNCSTSVMRAVGSAHSDPYSALAAAGAALYGPLHGGANEQVLRMLREIGSASGVPAYIKRVKAGEMRLMGFGHRVYRNFDPRAEIIKRVADEVFEVTGRNSLLDIALELERIALQDDYFIAHKLYPNVDFYSGIIYAARPNSVIVLTPHNVHVERHLAVVTSATLAGTLEESVIPIQLRVPADRELALGILDRLSAALVPAVGVSFGGNVPAEAVMPMDWAVLIPLWFMGGRASPPVPTVVLAPARDLPPQEHLRAGEAILAAIQASDRRVALIASCDHGHAHRADGPYGFHPAAAEFDRQVVERLRGGQLAGVAALDPSLVADAKADSWWQMLILQGALGDGWRAHLLSYEVPTYFGMLCAAFSRS